jgi:competence protein ComEC
LRFRAGIEAWLEAERGQLFLWVPVMLGAGIAAWFALPDAMRWGAAVLGALALAVAGLAASDGGRAARVVTAGAFLTMVAGGLWFAVWRTRVRFAGLVPAAIGALWALATPTPDLLVTGDGRHLAIRTDAGAMALLRDRAGDYVRDMLAENGGVDSELPALAEQDGARCSPDVCVVAVERGGRRWRIAATRSDYMLPWEEVIALCRSVDIVVADRRLPPGCKPKWLKLDRAALAKSGGLTITFAGGTVRTVRRPGDRHPWLAPVKVMAPRPHGPGKRSNSGT